MRCALRVTTAAVLFVLATAMPAAAKGPTRAVIRGPGLETPIVLSPHDGGERAYWRFVERSGVFNGLWCEGCRGSIHESSAGSLGPRFTVTYTLPTHTGRGSGEHVVQLLYPFAEPRAISFVAAGQPYWDLNTVGGWSRTRPGFVTLVRTLGVEPVEDRAEPRPVTASASGNTPAVSRSFAEVAAVIGGIVALVAAVLIGRRRIGRPRRSSPQGS